MIYVLPRLQKIFDIENIEKIGYFTLGGFLALMGCLFLTKKKKHAINCETQTFLDQWKYAEDLVITNTKHGNYLFVYHSLFVQII